VAEVLFSTGALMVVVLPLTQVIVPPVASVELFSGCELPPVLPPLHPLTTVVPDTVPVRVVHVILENLAWAAAPAGPAASTDAPVSGTVNAAATSNALRMFLSS
jgi:hypothetical protein